MKNCAQVGCLQGSYRYTRSTKHKILQKYVQLISSCYIRADGEIKVAQIINIFFIFVFIALKLLQEANFQSSM